MEQPSFDDEALARLAIVGADILKEKFGFSGRQATEWVKEFLNRLEDNALHIEETANIQ